MAYVNTTDFTPRLRAQIDRVLASMGQGFNAYLEALSRRDQIEALMAKSDDQLARMGITRDGIVQHVFRDRLGL